MKTRLYVQWGMKLGIVLMLVYAAISCGKIFLKQYKMYTYTTSSFGDPISGYEKRFTGLRQLLPQKGAVGYLNDVPAPFLIGDGGPNDNRRFGTLYLTQYVLSPVVVYDTPQYPLVVGNFHSSPHPSPELLKSLRLRPIENYGNGVFLFKREGME